MPHSEPLSLVPRSTESVESGPSHLLRFIQLIMARPCIARVLSICRLAVLHQCIRPFGVPCSGPPWTSSQTFLLAHRPRADHLSHQGLHTPRKPILHIVSSSCRPRREIGMRCYVIAVFLVCIFFVCATSAVSLSRPTVAAGCRAEGLPRPAALCGHPRSAWS